MSGSPKRFRLHVASIRRKKKLHVDIAGHYGGATIETARCV